MRALLEGGAHAIPGFDTDRCTCCCEWLSRCANRYFPEGRRRPTGMHEEERDVCHEQHAEEGQKAFHRAERIVPGGGPGKGPVLGTLPQYTNYRSAAASFHSP